jgi:hypothetical protein
MDEIKVIRTDEDVTYDEQSRPVFRVRVQWKLGAHGPFFTHFSKDGFSGVAARQRLNELAEEYRALNG